MSNRGSLNNEITTPRAHVFEKTHFSKFTWCFKCEGFIYGIGKQGYRCKNCNFTAHTRCTAEVTSNCEQTKGNIEQIEKKQPLLRRRETQKIVKVLPKTEEEERLDPLTQSKYVAQSSPENESPHGETIQKEEQEIILNILVAILKPEIISENATEQNSSSSGAWKSVDGGYSRFVIYTTKEGQNYRAIAKSSLGKFIINSWIGTTFKYRKLSPTFIVIQFGPDLDYYGLSFNNSNTADSFENIIKMTVTKVDENEKKKLEKEALESSVSPLPSRSGSKLNQPPQTTPSSPENLSQTKSPSISRESPISPTPLRKATSTSLPQPQNLNSSNSPIQSRQGTPPLPENLSSPTTPQSTGKSSPIRPRKNTPNAPQLQNSEEPILESDEFISSSRSSTFERRIMRKGRVLNIKAALISSNPDMSKYTAHNKEEAQTPAVARRVIDKDSEISHYSSFHEDYATPPSSVSSIPSTPSSSISNEKRRSVISNETTITEKPTDEDLLYLLQLGEENTFEIEIELNNVEYIPGERIEGDLFLWLARATPASSVSVLFQGIEKAFNGLKDVGQKDYLSKNFFSHKVILWQPATKKTVLKAGEHYWSFSLELPSTLFPTMNFEDWCFIFYQARGFVEPVDPKHVKVKMISEPFFFDIIGLSETRIRQLQESSVPVQASNTINKISVNAHLKRNNFYLGEKVTTHLKINNSSKKSPCLVIQLYQKISVNCDKFRQDFAEIKIASKKSEEKIAKETDDQMKILEIQIPEGNDDTTLVLPSKENEGGLFKITHFIKIKFDRTTILTLPFIISDKKVSEDEMKYKQIFSSNRKLSRVDQM